MDVRSTKNTIVSKLEPIFGTTEAGAIAKWLITELAEISPVQFHFNPEIDKDALNLIQSTVNKMESGMPMQYAVGYTYFHELKIFCKKGALIPRPETEELCRLLLEHYEADLKKSFKILDIGTGTGCIPIYLKRNWKSAQLFALEPENQAYEIASKNFNFQKVQVRIIQEKIEDFSSAEKFDILISNPPYVPEKEKAEIESHVLYFEPDEALFVPDEDVMYYYKAILDFAENNLRIGGTIFFEGHSDTIDQIADLNSYFEFEIKKDFSGKKRFAIGRFK